MDPLLQHLLPVVVAFGLGFLAASRHYRARYRGDIRRFEREIGEKTMNIARLRQHLRRLARRLEITRQSQQTAHHQLERSSRRCANLRAMTHVLQQRLSRYQQYQDPEDAQRTAYYPPASNGRLQPANGSHTPLRSGAVPDLPTTNDR